MAAGSAFAVISIQGLCRFNAFNYFFTVISILFQYKACVGLILFARLLGGKFICISIQGLCRFNYVSDYSSLRVLVISIQGLCRFNLFPI